MKRLGGENGKQDRELLLNPGEHEESAGVVSVQGVPIGFSLSWEEGVDKGEGVEG